MRVLTGSPSSWGLERRARAVPVAGQLPDPELLEERRALPGGELTSECV